MVKETYIDFIEGATTKVEEEGADMEMELLSADTDQKITLDAEICDFNEIIHLMK